MNEAEFKKQYKQILGFHYVSCMNNTGIEELTNQLVTVALKEKYMGELIPVRILISKVKIYFY
jgi:hypothetical protein